MRVNPGVKHLSISDFPRTPWPVSFNVRQSLLKAFNYCRQYPDKMASLKAVLMHVVERIEEWEATSKKVEFQPGDQAAPMVSSTNRTHATTVLKSGQVSAPVVPEFKPTHSIDQNSAIPTLRGNNIVATAQSVPSAELPKRPAMTPEQRNPFKVSTQPAIEQEMQMEMQQQAENTPHQVGNTPYVAPSLAAALAAAQQS